MRPYAVLDVPQRKIITRDITDFVRLGVVMPDGSSVELHANGHGRFSVVQRTETGQSREIITGEIAEEVSAR